MNGLAARIVEGPYARYDVSSAFAGTNDVRLPLDGKLFDPSYYKVRGRELMIMANPGG